MTGNEFPGQNLFTVPHNPQQHQEQVDEIEIEGEGAYDGAFAHHAGLEAGGLGQGHVFQPLGVIDGQADEKEDPDVADDHRHAGALKKEVDHRGDDDADQTHEQEAAEARSGLFWWSSRRRWRPRRFRRTRRMSMRSRIWCRPETPPRVWLCLKVYLFKEKAVSTVMKISPQGQIRIPKDVMQALNIEKGDYVEVEIDQGRIILKPRKLIDPTQGWYWTKEWQQMEAEIDDELEKDGLSDEFRTAEKGLKWLKK